MVKYDNIIIIILYIISFFNTIYSQNNINSYFLSQKEEILEQSKIIKENLIDNAIYVIRNYEGDKNLDIEGNILTFLDKPKRPLKKHFRIYAVDKNTSRISDKDIINSDNYYLIEDKDFHNRIGIMNPQGIISLFQAPQEINVGINDNCLWKIFPKIIEKKVGNKINKKIYYYVQNKGNGKYLSYIEGSNGSLICNFEDVNKLTEKNYFIFNRMYREKSPKESLQILNKEPIDVLIKYIDLLDPNLKREGITQIKKDQENGEIKYCVRSILKNIPWIRKIFILMPNEKIKYFKDPEEIKEKIVYVKDIDLLGFDSAASNIFQFNLWKMKKFGLSENFILMDDDYFIGKPLKKSDFFYEENGKVYPSTITGDYYELNKQNLESSLKPLLHKIYRVGSHSSNGFSIRQKLSLLFLYSIFGDDDTRYGKPLIEPAFSHNTIPVKQSDIKEIYDYITKLYPYADETLSSKTRHIRSLQPQTLFFAYAKNKYDRRVKIIPSSFIDIAQFNGKIDSELFVINTSDRKYAPRFYTNEIKRLEQIFPESTPYEVDSITMEKIEKERINIIRNNINKKENNIKETKKDNNFKKEKNLEEIKNENKLKVEVNIKDLEFYDNLINYLKEQLDEKKKYNIDLLDIKNKLDILNEKYDKEEKQIEEITKKVNDAINQNVSLSTSIKSGNSSKNKILEILILIIVLLLFLIYLNRKGYFNEDHNNSSNNINYYDRNGFENMGNDRELNLINSKLEI